MLINYINICNCMDMYIKSIHLILNIYIHHCILHYFVYILYLIHLEMRRNLLTLQHTFTLTHILEKPEINHLVKLTDTRDFLCDSGLVKST